MFTWLSSFNPRVVGPSNMPFYPLVEANLNCGSMRRRTGDQGHLSEVIEVLDPLSEHRVR
jgi:hypothetical protein